MSVPFPLYAQAIDGIYDAIKEVADAEAIIDPVLGFVVSKNRARPYIESVTNKALVNVLLNKVDPTGMSSQYAERLTATYHLDMYVRGADTVLIPADESASTRLQLLTGQVMFAVKAMKNIRFNLDVGQIARNIESSLQFYELEDDRQSSSMYAPARYIFKCDFPYSPEDIISPALKTLDVDLVDSWRVQFNFS